MANLNIRNFPDEKYKKLKRKATVNKRSINKEIIYLLSGALENEDFSQNSIDSFYERVLKIRTKPKGKIDSTQLIRQMRDEV